MFQLNKNRKGELDFNLGLTLNYCTVVLNQVFSIWKIPLTPLAEVGQADAYNKQLQVKCSSLYSETVKVCLGLWWEGGGLCTVSTHKRETSPQKCIDSK